MDNTLARILVATSALTMVAGCAKPPATPEPPQPTTDAGADTPVDSEAAVPTVVIGTSPNEECDGDRHTLVTAVVTVDGEQRSLPDPGFETETCCTPFELRPSPDGTTAYVATCEPWSCGGGCLRTTRVLFLAHDAPDQSQWFELSCNENLSATAEGEVNDACDELAVTPDELAIELETTSSKACPGEDDGRIESAEVRRDRLVLSASGVTRTDGKPEPYKRDVWGCGD